MNISELVADCNYVQEDALLPLTDVRTKSDADKYAKMGYLIGYTVYEWRETFPRIPERFVYYLPNTNMGTYYFDKDKLLFINMHIYGKKTLTSRDEDYEKYFLACIKHQEERYAKGDYAGLFLAMPDGIRMNLMDELFAKEGPTGKFYDIFMEFYTTSNFRTTSLSVDIIRQLPSCKTKTQKQKTRRRLQKLFGDADTIPVYRGVADGSASPEEAISWTINLDVANFFACRLGSNGKIFKGEVARKDIIEFRAYEGESEILVLPGSVKVVSEMSLIYPDSKEFLSCFDVLNYLYQPWRKKIRALYVDKEDGEHDALHSLRVLFYACYIALQLDLEDDIIEEICEAAMYHDIGRRNDNTDAKHGIRSAVMYNKNGGKNPVVDFAIEMHCVNDDKAKEELAKRFGEDMQEHAWTVLSVLKDADALDRVRFGVGHSEEVRDDGVRISMLRYDISKRMTPLAMACLKQLTL